MLRKIKAASQNPGEPHRRWYSSLKMDLFVWFGDSNGIVSYQLTYNKPHKEKALVWKENGFFLHLGVDDGCRPGQYSGSPLFYRDGKINALNVVSLLNKDSGDLEVSIKDFIISGIDEYFISPVNNATHLL